MLDGSYAASVISLLSQSSNENEPLPSTVESFEKLNSFKKLKVRVSDVSERSSSSNVSPIWKTCAQKSLEFILKLDLDSFLTKFVTSDERVIFDRTRQVCEGIPGASRLLGVLLSRQWPKWHFLQDEFSVDDVAIDSLSSLGIIHTSGTDVAWDESEEVFPRLCGQKVLIKDLGFSKVQTQLDILLRSLTTPILRSLSHTPASQTISRPMLIKKVKTAYDGKQRKIFGGINDVQSLVNRISELHSSRLFLLDKKCRDLFVKLSFALDIDSDDEKSWNSALPQTLLKSFANKGIGGTLSPRRLSQAAPDMGRCENLRIYTSLEQLEATRTLSFLQYQVEAKRACPKTVSGNVREFLESMTVVWEKDSQPEWWWRRQLPRRCSNILWKCVAELERMKYYEIALDHLTYMIDNNENLLGRKRRGKVAIRLLIEMGHLNIPFENMKEKILRLDLFPADRCEILRRLGGFALSKYEWSCGPIDTRTITITGANTRDVNWVEQAALDEFYLLPDLGGYRQGVHCEGRVMNEIFSRLFKKFLEGPPDESVWQSPLQKWAMDIGFIEEGSERWGEGESILGEIRNKNFDQLSEYFSSVIDQPGNDSRFDILSILSCLTGNFLAGIMRLLLQDPYYWGGGQPDLLAWNTAEKKSYSPKSKDLATLCPRDKGGG